MERTRDLSSHIDAAHPSGLCALCDQPLERHDDTEVVEAFGYQHLVHISCAEEAEDEQCDDDNEDDEEETEGAA